eukprot:UN10263
MHTAASNKSKASREAPGGNKTDIKHTEVTRPKGEEE